MAELWVGAAVTMAAVTAPTAAAALPPVEEVAELTAVIACVAKFAAWAGRAVLATPTTWEIRFVAEFEVIVPMLFCTIFETVFMAVWTTFEKAGLAATAWDRGTGGWGSPPGGVIVTLPAETA